MYRTMNLKGFLLILAVMLILFLIFHSVLRGTVNEKMEEEFKNLNRKLNVIGTDEYIMSSAVKDYSYVQRDAIRFEFTNPEVLYAYSEDELRILMDEMND